MTNVLVVEDEPDLAEMLCGTLESAGYTSHMARSVNAACRAVKEYDPQLILMDLVLDRPRGGFELAEEIAASCPIIAMSASHLLLSEARFDPNFSAAIEKPFDLPGLLATIASVLELRLVAA